MTTLFSFDQFLPQPAVCNLIHPTTGKPLLDEKKKPIWVKTVGYDSAEFFAAVQAANKRKEEAVDEKETPLKGIQERAHYIADLAKDWHPAFGPFSRDAVFAKFSEINYGPYAEQIEQFVGDRANFFVK